MTGGPQLMTQLGPKGSGYPSVPKAPEEARQAEMPGRNTTNPVFPICEDNFILRETQAGFTARHSKVSIKGRAANLEKFL